MLRDYKELIPEPIYLCVCGADTFCADELYYYNDQGGDGGGEGFYCTECIEDSEEERIYETAESPKVDMIHSLLDEGVDMGTAEAAAEEMYPLDEPSEGGPCLADVLEGQE